ncbi:MAG: hypothetical protein ACP5JY_02515 [Candidatus Nanoarchaeia archaeon]
MLLNARKAKKILKIEDFAQNLSTIKGASKPNLRRQLRRLKMYKLVEKVPEGYRITEFGTIEQIISNYIKEYLIKPAIERIEQYAVLLDREIFDKEIFDLTKENQNQQKNNQT